MANRTIIKWLVFKWSVWSGKTRVNYGTVLTFCFQSFTSIKQYVFTAIWYLNIRVQEAKSWKKKTETNAYSGELNGEWWIGNNGEKD